MRPPIPILTRKEITPLVMAACRIVVDAPKPVIVPVRLESYSRPDCCHDNAAEKASRDGGSVLSGWAVWEVPEWEIRLDFHSIWQSPDGDFVDVSLPVHDGPEILFVPDPKRTYEGFNIPTLHYPHDDSPICREYVEIASAISHALMPPGEKPRPESVALEEELNGLRLRLRRLYAKAKSL